MVEWASLGSSPAPAGDSASRTSSNGEVLEVPLVPLPAVYLPSPSQQLMVSEAKYLKLYDDLLAKGARHFLVTHEAPLNSQPRVARVGLLFRLKELRDVSEETNGHSKYVAEHEVGRRARILAVLNGEQHLSSTEYLRATVELLPADESQTVDVHALQRIREKLQQALAIQGEQENRPGATAELGALANRLRLASVLRAPGFWDLCSMLGSLQSFRLQLQVRTMREEVRKMTEEWAQQNPQAFKDLKRNPQVLPSKIRASGERVKELLQEGTQELQSTFQEILQTPSLSDGAVRLEEAVEQELQRNLGLGGPDWNRPAYAVLRLNRIRHWGSHASMVSPGVTSQAPTLQSIRPPPVEHAEWSLVTAWLLAAYTSARFQKKLQAMARQQGVAKSGVHEPEFQEALKSLLRKPQMEIISRYGFRASREGIEEMQLELRLLEEDGDIYVNRVAIEEALLGPFEDLTQEVEPHSGQPSTKQGVYLLLRSLFLGFSEAWFQEALVKLQLKKDKAESRNAQARPDPDGYFHLPGRAELALEVHQKILPRFGFDATKEGVSDMIRHCAGFLQDPEVANLFDAINRKLGMSPSACVRFRRCCYDLRQPPWPAAMAAQPSGGACHLVHIR
ncbi:Lysosomal Pro-X carboxypeptidase [Durusdinium trenchii]|uniref:Lysosomal Pro-X carboxypeptidase n=1 Tax=Durusdinium trenchii TaxID=1381693 RepID=A0ABP0LFR7_9DINO